MAFINESTCECARSELDVFLMPPTQTAIENSKIMEYNPISAISDSAPIEFFIPSTGEEYVDLSSITLHTTCKILKGDNTDMDAQSHCAPINLIGHTMWSDCELMLGNTRINASNGNYAYDAYFRTVLSFGIDAKQSQLTSSLYYKDTAGHMQETNPVPDGCANKGLKSRWTYFRTSLPVQLQTRLMNDMFLQDKLLLDNVPIRIKLVRNKDAFCLMSDEGVTRYKLHITECVLSCRKVKLSVSTYLAHRDTLQHSNAKYPIRRTTLKTYTIPRGLNSHIQESLFSSQIPTRVIFACVTNAGYNGAYEENPFFFRDLDIREFKVVIDGQNQNIKPIKMHKAIGKYLEGYMSLFEVSNKLHKNEGLDINRGDFCSGYCMFCFDLSPDQNEDQNFNLIREGSLRVEITFGTALTSTVNVICFAEHESVIQVTKNREVILDY